MSHLRTNAIAVALLSWFVLSALVQRAPQGLHFYDPVVQLRAWQQHQQGETPSPHILQRVDPHDLSRDLAERIGWWPPAIPAALDPLATLLGLAIGPALRLVVIATGAIGVVGWALWWARFPLPPAWILGLCALLPWVRHASSFYFRFSGEIFAFAAAPWVFLGLAVILNGIRRADRPVLAPVAIGVAIGFTYWLKYSLFVSALAGLIATVLLTLMASSTWRTWVRFVLPLALGMAFGPLTLKFIHAAQGALDPVGRVNPDNVTLTLALFFVGNPALCLADAAGPFFDALVYPGIAGLGGHSQAVVAALGFPGGCLLAWMLTQILRDQNASAESRLAAAALPLFTMLMLGMWLTSDVARDTRFFIPVGFAALPAVLLAVRRGWSSHRPVARTALLMAGGIYLAVPFAYGPVFVALKLAHTRSLQPGPTGLALPSLGSADTAALVRTFAPHARADAVWILENLEGALEVPGRSLTRISGRSIAEDMRNIYRAPASLAHWATSRPVELRVPSTSHEAPPVWALTIPVNRPWTPLASAGSPVVVWTSTLQPRPLAPRP